MSAQPEHIGEQRMTVEQFLKLPEEDLYRLELVGGLVVREPAPGGRHGQICTLLTVALHRFVADRGLGTVLVNTAFVLNRDAQTVRVPDLCFLAARGRADTLLPESVVDGAPDLAIEVLSPSNRAGDIRTKVGDYLLAGGSVVWVVDPRRRRITVYAQDAPTRIVGGSEVLDGGDVLPGFQLPLIGLFEGRA